MNFLQQAIHDNVQRFGHHVQYVFPCQPGDQEFTYTIGLTAKYGYELIVFGLPARASAQILNQISVYLRDHHLPLDEPVGEFTNLPVQFKLCDPAKLGDYVRQAFNYYDREDIPVVQMVLCDKDGHFPDDPKFDHAYMDKRQTLLYPTTH